MFQKKKKNQVKTAAKTPVFLLALHANLGNLDCSSKPVFRLLATDDDLDQLRHDSNPSVGASRGPTLEAEEERGWRGRRETRRLRWAALVAG